MNRDTEKTENKTPLEQRKEVGALVKKWIDVEDVKAVAKVYAVESNNSEVYCRQLINRVLLGQLVNMRLFELLSEKAEAVKAVYVLKMESLGR